MKDEAMQVVINQFAKFDLSPSILRLSKEEQPNKKPAYTFSAYFDGFYIREKVFKNSSNEWCVHSYIGDRTMSDKDFISRIEYMKNTCKNFMQESIKAVNLQVSNIHEEYIKKGHDKHSKKQDNIRQERKNKHSRWN